MTLSSETAKVIYNGDGATTEFSVNFQYLIKSDVRVVHRATDNVETLWTESTEYSLSEAGHEAGGTLTVASLPTDYTPLNGERLIIKRALPIVQETNYPEGGQFPAIAHERALDRLAMIAQQLDESISRTVLLPETTALSDISIPEPIGSELIRWNVAGDDLETVAIANLDLINNAIFSNLAANHFIGYDGTQWINRTPSEVRTELALEKGTGATQIPTITDADGRYVRQGKHVLSFTASGLKPTPTDGASNLNTVEGGADNVPYDFVAFDDAANSFVYFKHTFGKMYDGGTVRLKFFGYSDTIDTNSVVLSVQALAQDDGQALTGTLGSQVFVTVTPTTASQIIASAWTANVTISGVAAISDQPIIFVLERLSDDALDTHAYPLNLTDVLVEYNVDQNNESAA
jgi:hypothetical protein